jgi:hypothetical protein
MLSLEVQKVLAAMLAVDKTRADAAITFCWPTLVKRGNNNYCCRVLAHRARCMRARGINSKSLHDSSSQGSTAIYCIYAPVASVCAKSFSSCFMARKKTYFTITDGLTEQDL